MGGKTWEVFMVRPVQFYGKANSCLLKYCDFCPVSSLLSVFGSGVSVKDEGVCPLAYFVHGMSSWLLIVHGSRILSPKWQGQ